MPASRSARAITFAPRSWPSRPGLATSTRIFRSISRSLTHTVNNYEVYHAIRGWELGLAGWEVQLRNPAPKAGSCKVTAMLTAALQSAIALAPLAEPAEQAGPLGRDAADILEGVLAGP